MHRRRLLDRGLAAPLAAGLGEEVAAVVIERQPLWNNRKFDHGPFDLIGDIHGCFDELHAFAEELGLRPDTPVAEGGIDGFVGQIGLGVVEPGKQALITGSSHTLLGQVAEPIHGHGFWGAYTDAVMPGQYTVEAGQASTGTVVAWFKNRFAKGATEEATKRGVDPYVVLNELARDAPVGSDGLIVVDYFQGNRTPHTDSRVRGMIWGLSLAHGEGRLFRAIIEGICYGTENILRTMRGQDFEPKLNVVSGGPAKSDLWMQMHADVSNVPISFTRVSDGPVLGSAMLAAVGPPT